MIELSTPFDWVVAIGVFMFGFIAVGALLLALRTRDEITRAVMADAIFYSMIIMYIIYSMNHFVPMVYYIVLLGTIVTGVLPTLSMARIISKGRR